MLTILTSLVFISFSGVMMPGPMFAVALAVATAALFTTTPAFAQSSSEDAAGAAIGGGGCAVNSGSALPTAGKFALGVVILGAGASSRMGQCKLLLPWGNTSVIGHLIRQWQSLTAHQIAVVLAAGDEVLLPLGAAATTVALSRFPLAEHVPCFIDPAHLPLALYVVTPVDSYVIEPGTMVDPVLRSAALDLPNETSLPAGTVVDVFVLGAVHAATAGLVWMRMMPRGQNLAQDAQPVQRSSYQTNS